MIQKLVRGLVAIFGIFPEILGIIIPIDFHIFQRGSNHQPGNNYSLCGLWNQTTTRGLHVVLIELWHRKSGLMALPEKVLFIEKGSLFPLDLEPKWPTFRMLIFHVRNLEYCMLQPGYNYGNSMYFIYPIHIYIYTYNYIPDAPWSIWVWVQPIHVCGSVYLSPEKTRLTTMVTIESVEVDIAWLT